MFPEVIEIDAFTTKYNTLLTFDSLPEKFRKQLSFDGLFNRVFIQKLLVHYEN